MGKIGITGLNVVAIYGSDLERSRQFYMDILGFEECGNYEPGILLKSGSVTIYLEGGRSPKPDTDTSAAEISPCFSALSIKDTYENLKEAGVTIETDYQEFGPEYSLFRILDPDGHVIEFAGKP